MNQSNLALSLYTSQLNNQSQLKPFSFQLPQNEPFNPILLANTDLENIKLSGYHMILKIKVISTKQLLSYVTSLVLSSLVIK